MPRMKIFNAQEEETFEAPPFFNTQERKKFFTLPLGLTNQLESCRTSTNKVSFVLMAGYFRSRRKFFGKQFRPADVEFVAARLGYESSEIDSASLAKQTYRRHQQQILEFFGYRKFDAEAYALCSRDIATLVRSQLRPKLILVEVIELLARHKVSLPSYNLLANLIVGETNRHKRNLIGIVDRHLTGEQREMLDALLKKESDPQEVESPLKVQRHRLTLLKKAFQSTKPAKIKANIADLQLLQGLYLRLEPVIKALGLTQQGLRYYANSVIKAEIFQVSRRAAEDRYLHLLSFIAHQTFRLQDTLIDTLLQAVQSALNTAQREHKEQYYAERIGRHQALKELATGLEQALISALADIEKIIADEQLSDHDKLLMITAFIKQQQPQRNEVTEQLQQLKDEVETAEQDGNYYALLNRRSLKLQNRVSDIVRHINFDAAASSPLLLKAITYYQQKEGEVERHGPLDFLSQRDREALFSEQGKFQVSLYKALLFIKVAEAVKAGTLNLVHSHKYRSLDDYLLPQESWDACRDEYLKRAELEDVDDCGRTLQSLAQTLSQQYARTNRRWREGDNPLLKLREDGSFHVTTPKQEETASASLLGFFPDRKYVSLLEVLSTVNQATSFLDEFEHWQFKYRRSKPPARTFFAGIIGYGCDIGKQKIAQISKQINESELEGAINWYFSLPNIEAANDRVLSVMDQMELPNLYRRDPAKLHTSSDGQKFEVAVESLNANYSFKYFGQSKGVSVYSFIDERHLLFHSTVISSAEREAAYVIDGLMHNEVVKSDIHSTDTHGYAEIVFGVSHLLGFSFAPRIKHLGEQRLYSFEKRKIYEDQDCEILPDAYIDTELIATHWDSILRLIATIKLKHTTASQLFKRLNSYSKQHTLYRALKEFGKIIKTIFILNYIDDPELRQSIEKQLNKIESAQKFSKAISFGHNQEFIQSEKEEQEIAEGCRRLIKNAIVCWNYLYLSQKLREAESEEQKYILLEATKNGSVVSWQHINLHGEYDFSDEKLQDSVGLEVTKILPVRQVQKREG